MPPGYDVRPLTAEDSAALRAALLRNQDHLQPWLPERPEGFYSEAGIREHVTGALEATQRGGLASWLVWHDQAVVGRVTLSNVVRGVFQSCSLGYWVDHRHTGRGVATGAVRHAVEGAAVLGLHRVEAGTVVHHRASQAVLRRCGFEEVGTARRYLHIAGAWQDHLLFQKILHDDPPG